MTMRRCLTCLSLLALAACAPELPESGAGGNNSYNAYMRDATGQGTAPLGAPLGATATTTPPAGFDPARVGAAIDAAEQGQSAPFVQGGTAPATGPLTGPATTGGFTTVPQTANTGALIGGTASLEADRPRGNAPSNIQVESGEMAAVGGISDEQDFNAVAARETIESDAERIARNRSQYVVIQPTDVPQRPDASGPNIVEYAIRTTNAPGQQLYSRSAIRLTSPEAACARYRSPDLAQEAFLASGGPDRDPKGLDPDGDGFACAWDPRPFRLQ
jgi:hypothetical protein